MMEQNAPDHVIEYCYRDDTDDDFMYLCNHYESENSFVHKLRCGCSCNKFTLYKDEHPSVFAECANCGKVITVYDLAYYPSAVKLKKYFNLTKVDAVPVCVYVIYEYDDEYLYEEDVEFDANDITWAKVFSTNNSEIKKILDDETA